MGSTLKVRDFLQDTYLDLLQSAYELKLNEFVFGIWGTRKGVFIKLTEHGDRIRIKDKAHIASLVGELQKYCVNGNGNKTETHVPRPTMPGMPVQNTQQRISTHAPQALHQQVTSDSGVKQPLHNTPTITNIGTNMFGNVDISLKQNMLLPQPHQIPTLVMHQTPISKSDGMPATGIHPNLQVLWAQQTKLGQNASKGLDIMASNPTQIPINNQAESNDLSNESFLSMESVGDPRDGTRMVNAIDKLIKDQTDKKFGSGGANDLPLKCSTPARNTCDKNPFAGAWPNLTTSRQVNPASLSDRSYPTLPPTNPLSRGKSKTPYVLAAKK